MAINDFALSCAIDQVPSYFTYEGNSMVIVQSQDSAKVGKSDFGRMEEFISALISHESIHVVILNIENNVISEALDDVEVIVERCGQKFQVGINNIFFSSDPTGLVLE